MPDASTGTQSSGMPVKTSSKSPETPEARPESVAHLDTKPRKGDILTRSMDGQRVTVHRQDKEGNDASFTRSTTLGEQCEMLVDAIGAAVAGSVPAAASADVDVSDGDDEVTVTIKLSTDPKAFD